jgi:hypothetical protein
MPTFDDGVPVLSHHQATLLPKPITYRDSTSFVVTTIS